MKRFVWLALCTVIAGGGVSAQRAENSQTKEPGRNFDLRADIQTAAGADPRMLASSAQLGALASLQAEIPDLIVAMDETTGGTRSLYNAVGFLSRPAAGDALTVGLDWVNAHLDTLGLTAADLVDYEVTDSVSSEISGATHIYLRQRYRGIPVYNAQLHINVTRDGRIISVNNQFVPDLAAVAAGLEASVAPGRAVDAAMAHSGQPLAFVPGSSSNDAGAQQVSAVAHEGVSLEPIEARLMYLPVRPGEVRLVWNFQVWTADTQHAFDFNVDASTSEVWTRFDWVAGDSHRVYQKPVESPNHTTPVPPADGRTVQTNPANATASPFGWHDTNGVAGAEFTIMRGNNVHAYDDGDATPNTPPAVQPDCGAGLNCDFAVDLTLAPSAYTSAAVANLFYWNNIIHDVAYQYGFNEAGGNFQVNNYGHGGAGNDDVIAEAQDASGINNANFATPPDGQRPRMQMYVWNHVTPNRDGDFDSGIIVHEYGHGISNRLVGGPANVSCLQNAQQAGEGWSDWYGLVFTAKPGDTGTTARGIGTYGLNQPTTGRGIRGKVYTTTQGPDSDTQNDWIYASINGLSVPHGVGSVWAQALWEAYWALVNQHGFSANLYDAAGGSGNQRAMLYVTEGLKNTACSPTFTDARDGIIQAAVANYGGADVCRLWTSFAAFGLGANAISGGANSTSPTNGFARPLACMTDPRTVSVNDVSILEGNAGTTTASLTVSLNAAAPETMTVDFATTGGTATSAPLMGGALTIPSGGNANPYPSTITVPALSGSVTNVTVGINGFSHSFPRDVDVLLVGPTGQTLMLMSDVGSGNDAAGLNLVFDDAGPVLPTGNGSTLVSGTFKPTDFADGEGDDVFTGPAPVAPYGATLAGFNGLNPAGDWKLFVRDDFSIDGGAISSWSLSFVMTGGSGDFFPTSGTLTFNTGDLTKTIPIGIVGDAIAESNETVIVTLSNWTGGTIGDATGVVTILNDDAGPATMLTPTAGSQFTGTSATFTWTSGSGLSEIWLSIGTTAGGTEIYNATEAMATSRTVPGMPTDGGNVYVRLWSRGSGGWTFIDYVYLAVDHRAVLMVPAAGGTLPGASATFQWSMGGASATNKFLKVGTTVGAGDLYNADEGMGTIRTVSGLPTTGATVHVRLYTLLAAGWRFRDYSFASSNGTLASMTSPANGSALAATTVTFNWTIPGATSQVWLYAGTSVGESDFFNSNLGTATSQSVPNLPANGSQIFVRLWSLRSGVWQFVDYNYTATNHQAKLWLPAAGGTLPGGTATFKWTLGVGVTNKWLSVGTTPGGVDLYNAEQLAATARTITGLPTNGSTVYVRLWSRLGSVWAYSDYSFRASTSDMAAMTTPANGATLAASVNFTWTNSAAAQTWLSVGSAVGGTEFFNASTGTGTSQTVSGLPIDGSAIYVRLWTSQSGAWQFVDYHYNVAAILLLPAAGGTAPGSTAVFRWTTGVGATSKWLYVGTTYGGSDLYNAEQFNATAVEVTGLPTTGATLYARVWSSIGGVWHFTDSTFKAFDVSLANMTSPADGSTLGSASVTFNWARPAATTQVWLYVGTAVGGFSIYNSPEGLGTSRLVTGLPTNGSPVSVRLFSLVGGVWKYIDYYYTSASSLVEIDRSSFQAGSVSCGPAGDRSLPQRADAAAAAFRDTMTP